MIKTLLLICGREGDVSLSDDDMFCVCKSDSIQSVLRLYFMKPDLFCASLFMKLDLFCSLSLREIAFILLS
jgi:hypothetical protein